MKKELSNLTKSKGMQKWSVIVLIAVFVPVIVIGGVFFLIKQKGMFLNNRDKVLWALSNTLTEHDEAEDFLTKAVSISQSDEYTLGLEVEYQGDYSCIEYGHTPNGKQIHMETEQEGVFDREITAFIDENQLQMMHSDVKDTILVYHYSKEHTGYLFTDILPKETIESFNSSLKSIYETGLKSKSSSSSKTNVEAMAGAYKEMEFQEAGEKSFHLNGVSTVCQGYKTTLNKDISGIIHIEKGSEVTFYIDEKMIAAIVIESPKNDDENSKVEPSKMEIQFLGGDYRLQNVAVYEDGETLLDLEIKSLNTESTSTACTGEVRVNWEHLENMDTSGIMQLLRWSKSDHATESQWNDIELQFKKGVELEKMEGERLDIGNASLLEIGRTMLEMLLKYIGEQI